MEQLLRGEEIPAITKYDIESPVLYFPIRHHSPACSWHLKQAIEAYKPEVILIEGPENAQEQIRVLSHEDTKAPVALYYFYRDKRGLLSEEKGGTSGGSKAADTGAVYRPALWRDFDCHRRT